MNELKNRGISDILIAVVDGLKGFPEAINAVFPLTVIQTCIVHLIRHSLEFVSWKDRKLVVPALKAIYRAKNAEAGLKALAEFETSLGLLPSRRNVLAGVDRLEHGRDVANLARGNVAEDVAVPMHDTPLPGGIGEELGGTFRKPHARVRDDQPDAVQAAFLEMFEEAAPTRFVLFGAFADAENLPIALAIDPDRHQQRYVAHLARPGALEHDAVEINVGMFALDRPVAPGLDRSVNLLVQIRDRRGRHPSAPQCLNVLSNAKLRAFGIS